MISLTSLGNNCFEVGAFDAKTYFSELLRKVQEGAVINISKNGKKIAVLQGTKNVANQNALDAHKRILSRSKKMKDLLNSQGFEQISINEIEELKNAGRKF